VLGISAGGNATEMMSGTPQEAVGDQNTGVSVGLVAVREGGKRLRHAPVKIHTHPTLE